jgi:hypothetical protein
MKKTIVDVDLIELFIRQVSSLVHATADVIGPDDPMRMQAHLWRTLEANCRVKAEFADGIVKEITAMKANAPQPTTPA